MNLANERTWDHVDFIETLGMRPQYRIFNPTPNFSSLSHTEYVKRESIVIA